MTQTNTVVSSHDDNDDLVVIMNMLLKEHIKLNKTLDKMNNNLKSINERSHTISGNM